MIDSFNDLNKLKDTDTYSIALLLLFVMKDNPRYSTLSELSYILDHDNFLKFINYYAGQTIEIPEISEISKALKTIMVYQYYIIEGMEWKSAIVKAGFSEEESYKAQRLLTAFKKSLEEYKIGDFLNGTKQ